jgi:ATP-dependent DNA helicase RecQ
VYQLIDQDLLAREMDAGGRPILKLNDGARAVLKGQQQVRLIEPKSAKVKKAIAEEPSWETVDRGLFESLRALRREVAARRDVAPFIVFGDATLREMAAVRPGSEQSFISIRGIGQRKAADYATQFVAHITDYCRRHNLQLDAQSGSRPRSIMRPSSDRSKVTRPAASQLFGRSASISEVAHTFGVSQSTAIKYLCEYIAAYKPDGVSAWVDDATYHRIAAATTKSEDGRLKPIFDALNGEVPYDTIRIVVTHLQLDAAGR